MLMELKGLDGQLELYEDKVIIKRKGLSPKLTHGFFKGDKTIYLNQITGIQIRDGGALIRSGYIQFTLPGGNENTYGLFGKGLSVKGGAMNDENTVVFNKKDNDLAHKIKLKIEEIKMNSNLSTSNNSRTNNPDDIRKYKQLLDDGIITQEEYDKKKSEILGL